MSLSLVCELRGHSGDVNCCCWSPDDQTLCSCSGDKTVRLWNVASGKEIRPPLNAHIYYINACVYSPAGDILATASSDNTVKLWSTASWNCVGTLSGHEGAVRHASFSPDGNLIATASADSDAKVWEVASCKCIATLTRHNTDSSVTCCGFAPLIGWLLVTGSTNGDVIVFDVFSQRPMVKLRAHDNGVNSLHVAPPVGGGGVGGGGEEGETVLVATAGNDNCVKLWNVITSPRGVMVRSHAVLSGHSSHVYSCCFSPNGRLLASVSADKSLILWDMDTLQLAYRIEAHSRYITHCSFSPDGRYLTTASNDRTIKVWAVPQADGGGEVCSAPLLSADPQPQDTNSKPLIAGEEWSVEGVCGWMEAVGEQQNTKKYIHPDDMRVVERISRSLECISLSSTGPSSSSVDKFKCPITQEVIRDPVVATDGYTYERSAIMEWFSKGRRSSPVTNLPLTSTLLVPNRHFRTLLENST